MAPAQMKRRKFSPLRFPGENFTNASRKGLFPERIDGGLCGAGVFGETCARPPVPSPIDRNR